MGLHEQVTKALKDIIVVDAQASIVQKFKRILENLERKEAEKLPLAFRIAIDTPKEKR